MATKNRTRNIANSLGAYEEDKERSHLRIIYMHGKEEGCDQSGDDKKKQLFFF